MSVERRKGIPIQRIRIGIIGQTGYGKTWLTKELLSRFSRVVIFDVSDDEAYDEYESVESYYEMLDIITNEKKFRIVCRFQKLSDYDIAARILYGLGHRERDLTKLLLVVDEISLLCDVRKMSAAWADIFQRGRRRKIGIIWNTQRPALVNRTVTALSFELIAFRCDELRDVEYFPKSVRQYNFAAYKVGEYKFVKGDSKELGEVLDYKFNERKD